MEQISKRSPGLFLPAFHHSGSDRFLLVSELNIIFPKHSARRLSYVAFAVASG